MEGDWSCYRGGQFNGARMVMSTGGGQFNGGRHGHVTEEVYIMEGDMVMLRRWPVYMEGEWSCYKCGQFKWKEHWSWY